MDLGLQGFDSKPLTLVVGPEATELYVLKSILLQIPYFQEKIPDDIQAKYSIRLPDIDPSIAADVLYFTWTKEVPQIETPGEGEGDEEWAAAKAAATRHTKGYVICKLWGIQWLETAIRTMLIAYHDQFIMNPGDLMILHNAGLEGTLMYRFMTAQLIGIFQYFGSHLLKGSFPDIEKVLSIMPKAILLKLLMAKNILTACEKCEHCESCDENKRFKMPARQAHWLTDKE